MLLPLHENKEVSLDNLSLFCIAFLLGISFNRDIMLSFHRMYSQAQSSVQGMLVLMEQFWRL